MTAHPYHRKLARVLDRQGGMYTPQDILNAIAAQEMQSFIEGDSWAITRVALYPRGKVLEIVVMLGSIADMPSLHDQIIAFAREIGVSVLMAYGRRGWLPDALKRGWRLKARNYVYVREL
jgi:hypothetical protein